MLVELWSPAFKENGQSRPHIIFKPGLNVIKGCSDGANSIGKTSVLLAIDFLLAGDSYLRSGAIEEVGHHSIYGCFDFSGIKHYFKRSTSKSKEVIELDQHWKPTGTKFSLAEYGEFLADNYKLKLERSSWKQVRTTFFRIYGKENFNETNPLLGWPGENKETSLQIVFDVFGVYEELRILQERKNETSAELGAYKQAQKYRFVAASAQSVKDIEKEKERIRELEAKREQVISAATEPIQDSDLEAAQARLKLRRRLNDLERDLGALDRKIRLVETTQKYGIRPEQADLQRLQEFFPDVNVRSLLEVERFHRRLADVLEDGAKDELADLISKRASQEDELKSTRNALRDLGPGSSFSRDFLDYLRDIDEELGELKSRADAGETFRRLEANKKRAVDSFREAHEKVSVKVREAINSEMARISEVIVGSKKNSPVLEIHGFNSYRFSTPKDKGAGTNCRGLVIFDLAMLAISQLPAIAHDSDILKRCDDEAINGIMSQFESSKKQIFLAFDRATRYTQKVQQIADRHTVIELGPDGRSLYGESWNKREDV